jgi:hypothetical protein
MTAFDAELEPVEQARKRLSWLGRLLRDGRFGQAIAVIDASIAALQSLRVEVELHANQERRTAKTEPAIGPGIKRPTSKP